MSKEQLAVSLFKFASYIQNKDVKIELKTCSTLCSHRDALELTCFLSAFPLVK